MDIDIDKDIDIDEYIKKAAQPVHLVHNEADAVAMELWIFSACISLCFPRFMF